MKKMLCMLLALFLLPACAMAQDFDLEASAKTVCAQLTEGDYAAVAAQFDGNMAAVLDAQALESTMQSLGAMYGAFISTDGMQLIPASRAAVFTLSYANGQLALTIAFDENACISGLLLQPVQTAEPAGKPLPTGAQESGALLFAGTPRELRASIVTPANADESTPYVILVHGSGPSDMDQTIGPNKPFRDLAYDLAALGVGSMRFDKITHTHPELPCPTVTQEYLEPVSEALRVLKQQKAPARIYVAGHSLGGMLTPWLAAECGFDGGISLAGTPLALWQVSHAQNLALIALLPAEQQQAQLAAVSAEAAKAEALMEMSDEEAAAETVFGISAMYQRSIARLDEPALAQGSGLPFLFMWGEQDVQVSAEQFGAWQQALGGSDAFTFLTYPGLNHLFMPAQEGDSILNVQAAYSRPSAVDAQVAQDMADWISAQKE